MLQSPRDGRRADAAARRVRRSKALAAPAADRDLQFPTPTPAPGGIVREHWIQAIGVPWDIVPTGRDEWHGERVRGRTRFRALVYQEMTAGFAAPRQPARIPGPVLHAEVGDLLVVHFRNADERFEQGALGPDTTHRVLGDCPAMDATPDARATVLVVEDDDHLRKALTYGLEAEGFAVDAVPSASAVFERSSRRRPDVVLLDWWLADGEQGAAACRRLADELGAPVVMHTGMSDVRDRAAAFRAGAVAFLEKGMPIEELAARLRRVMADPA